MGLLGKNSFSSSRLIIYHRKNSVAVFILEDMLYYSTACFLKKGFFKLPLFLLEFTAGGAGLPDWNSIVSYVLV